VVARDGRTRPHRARSATSRGGPRSGARSRPVRVRPSTPDDLTVLVRHRRRMWEDIGKHAPREIERSDAPYRRWVRREMRAHRFFGFVAETDRGEVVASGAVWLHPVQPRPGPRARLDMPYILSMYTAPEHRGRGLASRLVRTMVRWAEARGYGRIFLHASVKGRPVYARLGFVDGNEMRHELGGRRRARR
jgi:GNAT superfamily N-acetyltransferase